METGRGGVADSGHYRSQVRHTNSSVTCSLALTTAHALPVMHFGHPCMLLHPVSGVLAPSNSSHAESDGCLLLPLLCPDTRIDV